LCRRHHSSGGRHIITAVASFRADDAPTVYITGNPAQTAAATRTLEQQAAGLVGFDPITGGDNKVAQALADHAEMALLHMISYDPARTPSFTLFGNPDYFLSASSTAPCTPPTDSASCFVQSRDNVWNHGDFQKEIVRTWLGIVGPGVRKEGRTDELFTDHTDIRPTILSLVNLKDDYAHDGRVVFEIIDRDALPDSLRDHRETLSRMAEAYKQINAPTGKLGIKTLTGISTRALQSDSVTYAALESKIVSLTSQRNEIACKMIALLENAAFNGQEVDDEEAEHLTHQANELLESFERID
jgi:hypothetical protein